MGPIHIRREGEPIRVAHVVHGFDTGGLEHGIVKLLNALPPERYRHAIISLTTLGALAGRVAAPGTSYLALEKREGNDPALVYRLATALRALRPHVLRTYAWPTWAEGTLAGALAGVRVHIHGLYYFQSPAQRARRPKAEPVLAALSDAVIAVSGDIGRELRASGVPARKVHVIRNGVDTDFFRPPAAEERAAARAALGLRPGTIAVGSVGRLVPEKDYPSLARARSRPPRAGATWRS